MPPLPASPQAWAKAARRDILAGYAVLRDNHPGSVDPDSPGFARQLAKARDTGLALARQVTSAMGYSAAISAFGNALQDGHASAGAILPPALRPGRTWPGFVPVWRGGQLLVQYSAEPAAPRGARLLSCDGTPIAALVLRNVFRFRGRPSEPGNWWVQARDVLVDSGNPFVHRPATCRLAQGQRRWTVRLHWRPEEGTTLTEWRATGYNGPILPIGLTAPARGIAWIAMPSFDPDPAGVAAYQRLNAVLEAQHGEIARGRAVVLDLRSNQGGSSEWSRDIARRLWGTAAVDTRMQRYFARTTVVWRASPGNEAHLRASVPGVRADGFAALADEWAGLADAMAKARAEGQATLTEPDADAGKPLPALALPELAIPVYVIVPGQCASACLDALDTFTRFPNTRLIGAPSSADSKFMEVRLEKLPSGLAGVAVPTKMYMNRPRGHGVAYRPALEVTALDWSTDDFLRVIEADLARRRPPG